MKQSWIGSMLLLAICGCGKSGPSPTMTTLPVAGTVTLDGKPLPGADVVFMGSEAASVYVGRTDDKGEYQLRGAGNAQVNCQGKCRVTISRLVKPDGSLPAADEPPANSGATESLPSRYSDAAFTELSADVPDGGGKVNFDLKSG